MKFWAYLQDEAPALGCGRRVISLEKLGWKWVTIADPVTGRRARLRRAIWDEIEARAKRLPDAA